VKQLGAWFGARGGVAPKRGAEEPGVTMVAGEHAIRVRTHTVDPLLAFEYEPKGMRVLKVLGAPVSATWAMCDSCSITLERRQPDRPVARELADRLASGGNVDLQPLIEVIAKAVPSDDYDVLLLTIHPDMVQPGDPGDYFEDESKALFEYDSGSSTDAYWREPMIELPPDPKLATDRRLLFHLIAPLEPIATLDPGRVEHYVPTADQGQLSPAIGLSVLDVRAPANWYRQDGYEHHWTLTTYVLDGHHRIQAASQAGAAMPILLFITREKWNGDEVDLVVETLAGRSV
jgi:hypothetical protein